MRPTPAFFVSAFGILALAALALTAAAAWVWWAAPTPYPGGLRNRLNPPSLTLIRQQSCLAFSWVNKSFYTTAQHQADVLAWLRGHGWMKNYRFNDSVLRQSARQLGSDLQLFTSQEIFVEDIAAGAHFVSTTQTTVSVGQC